MVNMIIGEGELFKIEGDKWTPELKNICLKCLNFNPIARPTAKEIVDLLILYKTMYFYKINNNKCHKH